jgi:adenine-specific DNA-methyltransferase
MVETLRMSHPLLDLRRSLRSSSTDAERLLWRFLRARRSGVKFRRQHSIGRYIVDFYCVEARLVIELDGGQHYEPEHEKHDAYRTRVLEALGLRVIRFTNIEVLCSPDVVREAIARVLDCPLPNPLPQQRERGPEA